MVHVFLCALLATSWLTVLPPSAAGQGLKKGITWYGVLQDGLDEARRTGKPILLTSAAPQCQACGDRASKIRTGVS